MRHSSLGSNVDNRRKNYIDDTEVAPREKEKPSTVINSATVRRTDVGLTPSPERAKIAYLVGQW